MALAKPAAAKIATVKTASGARRQSPYRRTRETEKAHEYYPAAWGVEHLQTALTSSGNLVRFTFRVLDPKRAKPFADHAATPYLYAPRTHAVLQVPTMEQIGQLRQLGNLESNLRRIIVTLGSVVYRHDQASHRRTLRGDRAAQVRRERGNATFPGEIIAKEGNFTDGRRVLHG
jgi:hypothetical protein